MVHTSTKNVFAQINFLNFIVKKKKKRFNVASGAWYVIYENRPSGPKEPTSWTSQHETGPRTHEVVKPNVHIFLTADGKCVRFLRRTTGTVVERVDLNDGTNRQALVYGLAVYRRFRCKLPWRERALCHERGLFIAAGGEGGGEMAK